MEDVFVTEDEQVLTVQREKREAGTDRLKKERARLKHWRAIIKEISAFFVSIL